MTTELLSLPADGYLLRTGALVGRLGRSIAGAPLLKGAMQGRGYVLLHKDSAGGWRSYRLPGRDHREAEAIAHGVAASTGRPIVLAALVQAARGAEVLQAVSTHEMVSESDLLSRALAAANTISATELAKADPPNPYRKTVFEQLTNELTADIVEKADPKVRAAVERTVATSKVNWASPSQKQLEAFAKRLATALGVASAAAWKAVQSSVNGAAQGMARAARKAFVDEHKLGGLATSVNLEDKRAIARSVATQAHYIRDYATNQLAPSLSAQARTIMQQGIARGAGSVEIGRDLHEALSTAASGQTASYFRMTASAVNARAREYSSLTTMRDAGIEQWEWSSVLDEDTTESCRWLDGQSPARTRTSSGWTSAARTGTHASRWSRNLRSASETRRARTRKPWASRGWSSTTTAHRQRTGTDAAHRSPWSDGDSQEKTMSGIVTPGVIRHVTPRQLEQLTVIIARVVARSLKRQQQKLYTEGAVSQHEEKRRLRFCTETALRWLKEYKFPMEQIKDELKTTLERWLEHGEYEPDPKRNLWADPDAPKAAGRPEPEPGEVDPAEVKP
jgi:hypothetical protein